MKLKLITAICFVLLSCPVFAKTERGIYMNAADYRNNKLTYEADCANQKLKVHLHGFWGNAASFTVIADGRRHTFKKNEVFGFSDCKNNNYRFYQNAAYRIVDAGRIYIYTQERNVTQGKGFKVVNDYFFSNGVDGNIVRLNKQNLLSAYTGNEKFMKQVEACHNDLTAYDDGHKMFQINYLYTESLK